MEEKFKEITSKKFGFREDFDWETRFDLKTQVGDYEVSTVDLGINHQFIDGLPPLYYETMIFLKGNDLEEENIFVDYQVRYSTEKEARKGHEEAVNYVNKKIKETKE